MNTSGRKLFEFLKRNAPTMDDSDFHEIVAAVGMRMIKLCVLWAAIGLGAGFALGAWLI